MVSFSPSGADKAVMQRACSSFLQTGWSGAVGHGVGRAFASSTGPGACTPPAEVTGRGKPSPPPSPGAARRSPGRGRDAVGTSRGASSQSVGPRRAPPGPSPGHPLIPAFHRSEPIRLLGVATARELVLHRDGTSSPFQAATTRASRRPTGSPARIAAHAEVAAPAWDMATVADPWLPEGPRSRPTSEMS